MENDVDIYQLATHGFNNLNKFESTLKCAELFFGVSEYLNIEIEENSIKNIEKGSDEGVSIRAIGRNGSLGFSFTNRLNNQSIDLMVENSIKMMRSGTKDSEFIDIPQPIDSYPKVKDLYDENVQSLTIDDSIDYVTELIRICDEDEMAISQSANFAASTSKNIILNTNGVKVEGEETICSVSSHIIVKDKLKDRTSNGFEYQSERFLKNINPTLVINTALNKAKQNLNRIKIKSMRSPIILTPRGVISLILKPIASAINAEAFQYKRTFLVDKRNEKIGSDLITIEDNGLINGAVGSANFDAEGVPCQNTKIIDNGVFLNQGLLHNSYTAGKEGVESTGNASRQSYSSTPSIGISNFILSPGKIGKNELIEDIKEGILLDYTGDRPNLSTGDFSGLILHGNIIENGEIGPALNETMIGINLLELFKKIEHVSSEYKTYGSYQAPYLQVNDIQIIGSHN
ncbi:MAG: TldD/PmbA family protein [Candidatus Lokiarchaeota archaeon]|nr:TldD/PmbA family protein [Candidatus Lokiarchaeota archaeon]